MYTKNMFYGLKCTNYPTSVKCTLITACTITDGQHVYKSLHLHRLLMVYGWTHLSSSQRIFESKANHNKSRCLLCECTEWKCALISQRSKSLAIISIIYTQLVYNTFIIIGNLEPAWGCLCNREDVTVRWNREPIQHQCHICFVSRLHFHNNWACPKKASMKWVTQQCVQPLLHTTTEAWS